MDENQKKELAGAVIKVYDHFTEIVEDIQDLQNYIEDLRIKVAKIVDEE